MRIGLSENNYLRPFAGTIAAIVAVPLAEMAASLSDRQPALLRTIINIALRAMGKETITAESQDLFMAKTVGRFAGNILREIETQEQSVTPRADNIRLSQRKAEAIPHSMSKF